MWKCLFYPLFFKNPVQEWQSLFKCEGEVVIKQVAIGGVLYKKVFLKISKILEETTCVESPFNLKAYCIFIKKRLQHGCFPVKFAKSLRACILKGICVRLLFIRERFRLFGLRSHDSKSGVIVFPFHNTIGIDSLFIALKEVMWMATVIKISRKKRCIIVWIIVDYFSLGLPI